MAIIEREQQQAAQAFVQYWQEARGNERSETQTFWNALLHDALGVSEPKKLIAYDVKVALAHASFIDAQIPSTHVLIEHKSRGTDLSKAKLQSDGSMLTPFEQAKRYDNHLPYSKRARFIVLCNFDEFWLYDLEQAKPTPEIIALSELPQQLNRFEFLVDRSLVDAEHAIAQQKAALSIEAGKVVAQLYNKLFSLYQEPDKELVQKNLNKLCVRLVFCWYADDAGLFGGLNRFHDYLQNTPPEYCRWALQKLFQVLDTPVALRSKDESAQLLDFPYVNGGLFHDAESDLLPQISAEVRDFIVNKAGASFDWSKISPTIFGAVFESTLNPETRRKGGMHYTSVENIHKVIDPLFLDELNEELAECMQIKSLKSRTTQLLAFQQKLASLTFLDPACGSGNFLTEAYICLRRLENQIIRELNANQAFLGIDDLNPVKISLNQFAGIEINDFAVSVAKTALWIAESQMLEETSSIINHSIDFFPLKNYDNIVEGNALTTQWEQVVPLQQLSYIMGNPPFSGARLMTSANKQDLKTALGSKWPSNVGDLDFVCGWFKKAHDMMMLAPHIKTAFVATNSICQGTSAANLWEPLLKGGSEIIFAHRSFLWDNEASDKAHVFCVIVGFASKLHPRQSIKRIYSGDFSITATHINNYLLEGDDAFIYERKTPLCQVPIGSMGNQPIDDGNYLFTQEEKDTFLKIEPQAAPYFKRWYGGAELLQGKVSYCLYLGDCSVAELAKMPEVRKRVEAVRQFRINSPRKSTVKKADTPLEFATKNIPTSNYLVIPKNSSGRRSYIPIAFFGTDALCGDMLKLFPKANLYHFSILSSSIHMVWTNIVSGRIKMDFNYSTELVYNNFPWPQDVDSKLKQQLEATAQGILDARAQEKDATLAQLYDQTLMPAALRRAHNANDRLVMRAYGFNENWSEDQIFAALYQLYQQLSSGQKPSRSAKENKVKAA